MKKPFRSFPIGRIVPVYFISLPMGGLSDKIIVSFDDFGISETANNNALRFIDSKKVERVAIMMNGVLRPEDVAALLQSGVKLDIHLDRKPEIDKNRKLKDTFFRRFIIFIFSYFFGDNRPAKIREVWRDQLEKFQETFHKNPDGISSHEHVHFFPPYFRQILLLSKRYRISFIRFGRRRSRNYNFVAFVLNLLRLFNWRAFRKSEMETSDQMISWDWVEEERSLVDFANRLKADTRSEVIFHPERIEECIFLEKVFADDFSAL